MVCGGRQVLVVQNPPKTAGSHRAPHGRQLGNWHLVVLLPAEFAPPHPKTFRIELSTYLPSYIDLPTLTYHRYTQVEGTYLPTYLIPMQLLQPVMVKRYLQVGRSKIQVSTYNIQCLGLGRQGIQVTVSLYSSVQGPTRILWCFIPIGIGIQVPTCLCTYLQLAQIDPTRYRQIGRYLPR